MDLIDIFDSFYDKIYSFTLLRVGNVHDAEDLSSDVFVKVVEKLYTYNSEKAAFSTWIFTIALNEIKMHYRRSKKVCSLDDINELAGQLNIEDDLLQHEERVSLLRAIDELDERRKNVVVLKYFSGLSDRQVAEAMKLSEKNVGVILSRTRRILQKRLTGRREAFGYAKIDTGARDIAKRKMMVQHKIALYEDNHANTTRGESAFTDNFYNTAIMYVSDSA